MATILRRASSFYKKKFKNSQFASYPIYQSKQIHLNEQTFILVGQMTEKDNLILTNYTVYNEESEVENVSISKEIYKIVMIGVFIESLEPLRKFLIGQENSKEILERFKRMRTD